MSSSGKVTFYGSTCRRQLPDDGNENWTFNANRKGYIYFADIDVNGHERIDFMYPLSSNKLAITMTVDSTTMSSTATVSFSEDGKTLYIYQEEDEEPIVLKKIK